MNPIRPAMLAALAAATPTVSADQVTLQAVRDNTLYESPTGALSNGQGIGFIAGVNNLGDIRRGLVAFDVAGGVPAGVTITGATLTLEVIQTSSGDQTIGLHRALGDWGEGTSMAQGFGGGGAPATPDDATWLHTFYDRGFWTTEGGDFAAVPSASTVVGGLGAYTWSAPGMVDDVQAWLDTPAGDDGWLLSGNEVGFGTTKAFATHEHSEVAFRPTLAITYVPGPGGLALAGLALAGVRSRRRR